MNETLRRALLRARLSEEDVAAGLQVDPKTVRRWLEGRVPYRRHRWLLAAALGLDEADLWPHLGASRTWAQEVRAIYPHCEDIPRETWLHLFGAAQENIDILADSNFLYTDAEILAILADRAAAGVKERICFCNPDMLEVGTRESLGMWHKQISRALAGLHSLRDCGDVEVRIHGMQLSNSMYRSDEECLVAPSIYGIHASRAPVIHLSRARGNEIFESYLKSFEEIWISVDSP